MMRIHNTTVVTAVVAVAGATLVACTGSGPPLADATDLDAMPSIDAKVDAPPPGEYQFVYVKHGSDDPFDASKEIVLGSLDGRYYTVRRVFGGFRQAGQPAVSPDGMRIAFVSFNETTMDSRLFVRSIDANATDEHELARDIRLGTPVWSPDGTMIAYQTGYGETHALFIIPADGSVAPRRLASIPWGTAEDGACHAPAWSPDGAEIAFAEGRDIVSVELATGTLVRRTQSIAERRCHAQWSPDGSALAFTRWDGGGPAQIERVERTGGMPLPIAPIFGSEEAGQLRWSPDGTRIAYVDVVGGGPWVTTLMVVGASGSPAPAQLAIIEASTAAGHPQWSPDGSTILYVDFDAPSARGALVTVPAAGGTPTRSGLLGASIDGAHPAWLPAPITR